MVRLNRADIQGMVLRGYRFTHSRHLMMRVTGAASGQRLLAGLIPMVTTAEHWGGEKPMSTMNLAISYGGLERLGLPNESLLGFPDEFIEGMEARHELLGDAGPSAPERWEPVWRGRQVDLWIGVLGRTPEALEAACSAIEKLAAETGGATVLTRQNAGLLPGQVEHFGYRDGFGNPAFEGDERDARPGMGKLTNDGKWVPLATGEFLLGYPDEGGEIPPAPLPDALSRNGTFLVVRKLHQNVASFRAYVEAQAKHYGGGKEKLGAKMIGRWKDGTPLELSPDGPNPAISGDPSRISDFTYGGDPDGARCPLGGHIRRANPRDALGFHGLLANRRRIIRRGIPYGPYTPDDQPVRDDGDHGIIFLALNASPFRQFEFVQQQWMQYGNDFHQGGDKDPIAGNNGGAGRMMIQGNGSTSNPPYLCSGLPTFVETRGGDYFFLPSLTALRLIASGSVDPR
jgi:Dyp-type peroxidase family